MYVFYKSCIIFRKTFIFPLEKVHSVKRIHPPQKTFIFVKDISFHEKEKKSFWKKKFILEKRHSLKNKFYFQFSFSTNEQV